MRVIFFTGGSVNEFGPFEVNEVVNLPEDVALSLIANGQAKPIEQPSARRITITLKAQEKSDV